PQTSGTGGNRLVAQAAHSLGDDLVLDGSRLAWCEVADGPAQRVLATAMLQAWIERIGEDDLAGRCRSCVGDRQLIGQGVVKQGLRRADFAEFERGTGDAGGDALAVFEDYAGTGADVAVACGFDHQLDPPALAGLQRSQAPNEFWIARRRFGCGT